MQRVRLLVTDGIPGVTPGRYAVGDEGYITRNLDGSWNNYVATIALDRYITDWVCDYPLNFRADEFEVL